MTIALPPNLPLDVIRAHAEEHYALHGEFRTLDGERDQNSRVISKDGSFVVKVCNPSEGTDVVQGQVSALEHIGLVDPGLPVPRLRRTRTQSQISTLVHEDQSYPVAVLSWLEGEVVGDRHLTLGQYRAMGRLVARLGRALRGFVHHAPAQRQLWWNTLHADALLPHAADAQGAAQNLARDALQDFVHETRPRLAHCRSQIIHGDVHPYNMLMSRDGAIDGVIDFGDMIHAPLVIDIANTIADCLVPGRDLAAVAAALVSGYASVTALEELEVDCLLSLVKTRLAATSVISRMRLAAGACLTPQIAALDMLSLDVLQSLQAEAGAAVQSAMRRAANFPHVAGKSSGDVVETLARRRAAMGSKPLLFYDPPLHIVRGEGVWLEASDGHRYLDCYNNVAQVGHCHPYVVEAVVRQLRVLNTNTRYLTDQSIAYAERLKATVDPSLSAVVFVNSGSEANDIAWRMAKVWTGQHGALAMDFAYHGVTDATDTLSPSNYPGNWNAPHVRLLTAPDDYRGPYRRGEAELARKYAALADSEIESLRASGHGLALAMIDSAFMTNGIIEAPEGYVAAIAGKVRAAGGLFVADEVQSGFGRMGTAMWGHQHHRIVPDFVTLGKPAGNGYPLGVVITRPEILDKFVEHAGPFFSTFGGGNGACAAGLAVLEVIRDEGLIANARETGNHFKSGLRTLMEHHEIIGDVRGHGLAIGVELVRDRNTLEPATEEARRLLNLIRDQGVLVGSDGKLGNVVKIRPPIVLTRENADFAVAAIDRALSNL